MLDLTKFETIEECTPKSNHGSRRAVGVSFRKNIIGLLNGTIDALKLTDKDRYAEISVGRYPFGIWEGMPKPLCLLIRFTTEKKFASYFVSTGAGYKRTISSKDLVTRYIGEIKGTIRCEKAIADAEQKALIVCIEGLKK